MTTCEPEAIVSSEPVATVRLEEDRLERLGLAVGTALGLHAALFLGMALAFWGPAAPEGPAPDPRPAPKVVDFDEPAFREAEKPPMPEVDPRAMAGLDDSKGLLEEGKEPEEANPFPVLGKDWEAATSLALDGGEEAGRGGGDPTLREDLGLEASMRIDNLFRDGMLVPRGETENGLGLGRGGPGGRPGRRKRAPVEMLRGVDLALRWLAAHQNKDGRWSCEGFGAQCGEACGVKGAACDGKGDPRWDVALTGLTLAAFLGDGRTHQGEGFHRETVKDGLDFLSREQRATGYIGDPADPEGMYNHALATYALAEAYAMTGDPKLRGRVENAVKALLHAQNPGKGWRYEDYNRPGVRIPLYGANDTSVTGWAVMALHAAEEGVKSGRAPLDIPPADFQGAYDGANAWLDQVLVPGPGGQEAYAYCHDGKPRFILGKDGKTQQMYVTTGAGALIRQFTGRPEKAAGAVRTIAEHLPRMGPEVPNFYEWYYTTLALYQHGGEPWERCAAAIETAVYRNLRRSADGRRASFDPVDEWGHIGGRVYATACAALCMESHWRFERGNRTMKGSALKERDGK